MLYYECYCSSCQLCLCVQPGRLSTCIIKGDPWPEDIVLWVHRMRQKQSSIEIAISDLNTSHNALIFKSILSTFFERHDDRGHVRISFFNYIYKRTRCLLPESKKGNNIHSLEYYLGWIVTSPKFKKVIILIDQLYLWMSECFACWKWKILFISHKTVKTNIFCQKLLLPTSIKLRNDFHASEPALKRSVSSICSTAALYCHIWPTLILQALQRISLHFSIFWQLHL